MGRFVTQFSVPAYDRPGVLGRLTDALVQAGINITALTTEGFGVTAFVRFTAEPEGKVSGVLTKAGYQVFESRAYAAEVTNKAGELARISQALGRAGVNIESVYGTSPEDGPATLVFAVDDWGKAERLF